MDPFLAIFNNISGVDEKMIAIANEIERRASIDPDKYILVPIGRPIMSQLSPDPIGVELSWVVTAPGVYADSQGKPFRKGIIGLEVLEVAEDLAFVLNEARKKRQLVDKIEAS